MAQTSGVYGDAEVIANLRALANVPNGTLSAAGRAALQPMARDTRAAVKQNRNYIGKWPGWPQPEATPAGGHADQGIVIRVGKNRTKGIVQVFMGARRRAVRILHLLEFGTAPHWQPRRGIMHPGARAFPAMRPAFEAHKNEAVRIFGETIFAKIIAKLKQR